VRPCAAMRSTALDPASLQGRAPVMHASRGSRSYLPAKVDSDAVMRSTTSDLTSLLTRAPVLPCVPRLSMGHCDTPSVTVAATLFKQ
jgi:hypothetical protein